jgi:hypothetical protein
MTVRVHIDRLILDGLPVDRLSASQVQAAVESELARLLAAGDWHPPGGAGASVAAPPIAIAADTRPGQLGTAVAGAIHGGLTG